MGVVGVDDFANCEVDEPKPELFVGNEVGERNGLEEPSPLDLNLSVVRRCAGNVV